jgi:hypothetical protein
MGDSNWLKGSHPIDHWQIDSLLIKIHRQLLDVHMHMQSPIGHWQIDSLIIKATVLEL